LICVGWFCGLVLLVLFVGGLRWVACLCGGIGGF